MVIDNGSSFIFYMLITSYIVNTFILGSITVSTLSDLTLNSSCSVWSLMENRYLGLCFGISGFDTLNSAHQLSKILP